MHQPQRNPGQEVVAEERAYPLPGGDQHDQDRHGVQQRQVGQPVDAGEQRSLGIAQTVDEVLEDPRHHRLGGGEDHVAEDANQEVADVGLHVGQQAEVDLEARLPGRTGHAAALVTVGRRGLYQRMKTSKDIARHRGCQHGFRQPPP
ncbi:hypothetical protein D3C86_1770660 [compost metagenome]